MKFIFALILSLPALSLATSGNYRAKHTPSPFEVLPLNSPVKGDTANFLLKVPATFQIDKVRFSITNANHLKTKDKKFEDTGLVDGPQGKELRISVSKLPPGFYKLFVKVIDKKGKKEHDFAAKFHDHVRFVIDESLQVPMPDPKKNNATLSGIDSDNDGIRDDIQRYINEKYASEPLVKIALKQFATTLQMNLITAYTNKEENILASHLGLNSLLCAVSLMDIKLVRSRTKELRVKTLNTIERLTAEKKSDLNFGGQTGGLEMDDSDYCQFSHK